MATRTPIVAIVGRTNVGKSSLYNTVLNRREAIVAREAGTTRDTLMSKAYWNEHEFWLVDTAGLKDPEDDFEFTIQEQIYMAADSADVIVVMVEAYIPINDDDRKLINIALRSKKPVIMAINKIDQAKGLDIDHMNRVGVKEYVLMSVSQRKGVDELLDKISNAIPTLATIQRKTDNIKLAIIGRPNVGKSYLFNSLAKKQQAIVSDRAGTTRDVNRTVIKYHGNNLELLDTAGMRRAGKMEMGVERFSALRTISAIEESDVCLLVMDNHELNVGLDMRLAGIIKEAGKGLVLVVSKWDDVEEKDAFTRDDLAAKLARTFDFVPWAPLIFTSAVTGQNITKLYDLTLEIYSTRATIVPTPELNKWLTAAVSHMPPSGMKNRTPKLNYMVQETDNPTPAFKIFGSNTKFVHFSYRRYLERRFRESFGFGGTPVQLWLIEKHVAHKHGESPTRNAKVA